MRIETLKSLIGAKLLNLPAITSINNVAFEAKKVHRGDLFFAYDYDDIAQAVQNGAYAIVVDKAVKIIDQEIAWLHVDSLKDSSIKLLRYHVEQVKKKFILLSSFEYEILSQITLSKDVQFLQNREKDIISVFDPNKKTFFSDDATFLKSFCKEFEDFKKLCKRYEYQLIQSTLYQSSFVYKDIFYKNIALPPFYINYFIHALDIANQFEIEYNEEKLGFCSFFYPQFLTQKLIPTEFGKGSKVLLFCCDVDLALKYCQKNLRHLKAVHHKNNNFNLLQKNLQNYDIVITSTLQSSVLQMPPFIQKNSTPTLF